MTDTTTTTERHINPHPWRTYWLRMRLPLALLVGYVPAILTASWLGGEVAAGVVMPAGMVAWLISILRVLASPCPRCGLDDGLLKRVGTNACRRCNFPRQLKWREV